MKFVNLLLSYNITPIMVFDGRNLPAKAETESRRRRDRDLAKEKAKEFLRDGKTDEARREFSKAVDITHEHAIELMKECRKVGVESVTAMYEADGQLAYLNKIGVAEYVISEDSDLILFGCKKILFKLQLTGHCLLFEADKLHATLNITEEKFCFDKFRRMCILSGCDYLDNLPGIGLAKARKFMMMTEETDMTRALLKIPSYLNMKKLTISDEYIEGFLKAEATFKFMFVYDPLNRGMCRLNALEEGDYLEKYCGNAGELLKPEIAYQLALGNLNPRSLAPMDNFDPDKTITQKKAGKHVSIWTKGSRQFAPVFKQQSKINSFFKSPRKQQKQLAEVQNIIEQENDVSCEVELDDLVSSYIADAVQTKPTSKRRTSVGNSESEVENEASSIRNPFVKRHQKEMRETADNVSLLGSLAFVNKFKKTPVNENHRIVSRFFVSKTQAPSNLPTQESSGSSDSNLEITNVNETLESQRQKLKNFYENIYPESDSPSTQSTSESLPKDECQTEETDVGSTQDDLVDLDKYEFKAKTQTQSHMNGIKPKAATQPLRNKPRAAGLYKAKTKTVEPSTQTKLSKFGFQTKVVLN